MLLTDNVPGKPRVFLMYIGGLDRYVERCETIVSEGYTGFNFTAPGDYRPGDQMPVSQ